MTWVLAAALLIETAVLIYIALVVRKRASRLVSESENRFRMFVNSVQDYAIFTLDPSGRITNWNDGAQRILGYHSSEVVGQNFSLLYLAKDRRDGVADRVLEKAQSTGRHEEEGWKIRSDGSRFWGNILVTPVLDNDRKLKGYMTIIRDITERKRNFEEVKKARDAAEFARAAAEDANRAKTNFLANISHEIRTPLGVVLGYAELLENPHQTRSDRHHAVTIIKRNGEMLSRIINDILDLSKIEANQVDVERENFPLVPLLHDMHSMFHQAAHEKGIKFVLRLDGEIPETIYSDPTRLRQILLNVVGNAMKFTEHGRVAVAVSVGYAGNSEQLKFVVSDDGPGIANTELGRLFRPFEQADSTPTRKFGGTGLGLALSRKLARALGGDLFLTRSDPGLGSEFSLTIDPGPLENVRMISKLDLEHEADVIPMETPVESAKLEGLNILVVEDFPDNQLLIARFLKMAGANVDIASNGLEALKKANGESHYDVVLMDIQMPELDGYQATKRLRTQGFDRPILALTAHALKEERDRCLEVGCDDHLTKPINRELLIDRVALYAGKRHSDMIKRFPKNLEARQVLH